MAIVALDVDYQLDPACAAGVVFSDWTSPNEEHSILRFIHAVKDYEPGQFYKRELPCLLDVLAHVDAKLHSLRCIVIDGYVWLDTDRPGLGMKLFEAIDGKTPVVGVAKTPFKQHRLCAQVFRGASKNPLYVTAVSMHLSDAAHAVQWMDGAFRIPTLLKKVDRLCRERQTPSKSS